MKIDLNTSLHYLSGTEVFRKKKDNQLKREKTYECMRVRTQ